MKKVLFVCLGNICRSPSAEAVFKYMIEEANLSDKILVDSCGTSDNHAGENADYRMQKHGRKRGYNLNSIARGIGPNDLDEFDYILTMDDENLSHVLAMTNESNLHKVYKLTDFCTKYDYTVVPDPYYGGPQGFELVLDLLEDACESLLSKVKEEL